METDISSDFNAEDQKRYSAGFVQDLTKLLAKNTYHDVELRCDDGIVYANKLHLACRSDYFRALFDFENQKSQNGTKSVDLTQFNSELVQLVVDTLIVVNDEKINSVDCINLLEIANYFQMPALIGVAIQTISAQLKAKTVVDVYKIAKKFENLDLKDNCEVFIATHIFQVQEYNKLIELENKDLDKIIAMRMAQNIPTLEILVDFLKNFYKLMKDLDQLEEFKDYINCLAIQHKALIYFALTSDKSVLGLQFGYDIEITEEMKIDPESDVGKILKPFIPKPEEPIYYGHLKRLRRCWTHKYGELSEGPFEFGPDWSLEGDFQKIKFYNTPVETVQQIICGLEITLKDGSVHHFGYTDSPNVEELDLEGLELTRLGICVSDESHLILAIQANCHEVGDGMPKCFFFPRDQHDLPFERHGQFNNSMFLFGPVEQRLHYSMMNGLFFGQYQVAGIKGKTVIIDGKPIICELQVKYIKEDKDYVPPYMEIDLLLEGFGNGVLEEAINAPFGPGGHPVQQYYVPM